MRSRTLTVALRAVVVVVVVVAAWTGVVLLLVRSDLTGARAALLRAQDTRQVQDASAPLARAQSDLERAVARLGQPGPRAAGAVPLVGRSIRAVSRSAVAALAVTRGTRGVLDVAGSGPPLLDGGRLDVGRLGEVERALRAASADSEQPVADLLAQPLGLVPGAVGGPVRDAQDEVRGIPQDLARAADGVRGLREVLGAKRPRSVLVVLENNAELRGTGGIVSVFAEGTAHDGRLDVGSFQDVEEVSDPAGQTRRVPAPADYHRLYGPFLADTTLWKNTNMDPDVPTSSQVLANVVATSLGRRPDVVLWLDVPTIAAVLRATGPARLPDGSTIDADNAVTRLLSTAYRDARDTLAGQRQRRAALRGAADAVLGDLLGSGASAPSPVPLARELFTAARGRHLALWSADPAVQRDLASAGVDGAVRAGGGDVSSFAVHNLGGGDRDGNKLDFYSRRQVAVDVRIGATSAQVRQEVVLRNTAPPSGLPVYVAGRSTPGVANSFVTMALPAGAQDVVFSRAGRQVLTAPQPSGDHEVVSDTASLSPGTSATWALQYRLPLTDGRYRLALLPQPLAFDAGLEVTVRAAQGRDLHAPGLSLAADRSGTLSETFDRNVTVDARVSRQGLLRRASAAVARFWSQPVTLG